MLNVVNIRILGVETKNVEVSEKNGVVRVESTELARMIRNILNTKYVKGLDYVKAVSVRHSRYGQGHNHIEVVLRGLGWQAKTDGLVIDDIVRDITKDFEQNFVEFKTPDDPHEDGGRHVGHSVATTTGQIVEFPGTYIRVTGYNE